MTTQKQKRNKVALFGEEGVMEQIADNIIDDNIEKAVKIGVEKGRKEMALEIMNVVLSKVNNELYKKG